ncbi:EF-P lysine aminoacylase EpmA [Motiliproteus sediminis]|uniref:EF-P lysine aminoacylase EpmA n=1 Tax=Motiliproteus sediminis TaxID=1468178 RepID=UPI001FE2BB20|nr:EF-P lysine aminoacylase EpmA [Motiliproteus sediminis]
MWQPTASLEAIHARARLYATIRQFFAERKVLEVDTPVLSTAAVSDPHLDPLPSRYEGPGAAEGTALFLQTSPEYAMKRLLAAGSGPIYQLAKAFRNGESGRRHNPEFCMLEWYRPGFDTVMLMDEVETLVAAVLKRDDFVRISYRDLFRQRFEIDPHRASVAALRSLAVQHLGVTFDDDDPDTWRQLLLAEVIEPCLQQPTFVYDFPASQAALAKVYEDAQGEAVAARFELFVNGIELANGYDELVDGDEQARRFAADAEQRRRLGKAVNPSDPHLVAALRAGMPACAGVALGVDRLLMLALELDHIDQVLAFPIARA